MIAPKISFDYTFVPLNTFFLGSTNMNKTEETVRSLTTNKGILNFHYVALLNHFGLFVFFFVSFYNNFPHCFLFVFNACLNSALLKRLKSGIIKALESKNIPSLHTVISC